MACEGKANALEALRCGRTYKHPTGEECAKVLTLSDARNL
jgi:hypothetical protein